jgi:hypothetical protein
VPYCSSPEYGARYSWRKYNNMNDLILLDMSRISVASLHIGNCAGWLVVLCITSSGNLRTRDYNRRLINKTDPITRSVFFMFSPSRCSERTCRHGTELTRSSRHCSSSLRQSPYRHSHFYVGYVAITTQPPECAIAPGRGAEPTP